MDGSRAPVTEYVRCNWGTVPANAIVTTSAKSQVSCKQQQLWLIRELIIDSHEIAT